jgi:hypothetical protein
MISQGNVYDILSSTIKSRFSAEWEFMSKKPEYIVIDILGFFLLTLLSFDIYL